MVSYSAPVRQNGQSGPTTPHAQPLPGITRTRFGLFRFRSPLLSESLLFSLPVGTEMFHFPTFPPNTLCVQVRVTGHDSSWVSPFGHPRINARLPTPRGLSQAPTSFIGSWCQGIHHVPLVACQTKNQQNCYKDARVHCVVLKIRAAPPNNLRLPTRQTCQATHQRRRAVRRNDGPSRRNKSPDPALRPAPGPDPSGPNSVLDPAPLSHSRFHAGQPQLTNSTDKRSKKN
jgi:hypothetical protein